MSGQRFSDNIFFELGASQKLSVIRNYNIHPVVKSDYYEIRQSQYFFPGSLLLHFGLGYRQKNGNELALGVRQDEIGNACFATVPGVNGQLKLYGSIACTNIFLLYKNLLFNIKSPYFKPNRFFKAYFDLGLSYIYRPNNGMEDLYGPRGQTFTLPDSNKVSVIFTDYAWPQRPEYSFKLNAGLTFSFGKNEREAFCLSITYITNRLAPDHTEFMFTRVETEVTNYNSTVVKSRSVAYFKAAGNGIYFSLSKRVFPFKLINNRRAKKIQEYKRENN